MIRFRHLLSFLLFVVTMMGCAPDSSIAQGDPFYGLYLEHCSVCHGAGFDGSAQGPPLVGLEPMYGDSLDQLITRIKTGYPMKGMPAFEETLDENQIRRLGILISEVRMTGVKATDFYHVKEPVVIPEETITTEEHDYRIETVAEDLDPLPYSIAPLPDGRILLTEKTRGLRIVSGDGQISPYISGTPKTHEDGFQIPEIWLKYGHGWMLDVAPHPDYNENGWIYLSYSDRCRDCNYLSSNTGNEVSMLKLIRGRIRDGRWVDEETLWQADSSTYTTTPDLAMGGRIAFDEAGHLFFSLGMKGLTNFYGIQDLSLPFGKIYRINDDGSIPEDNPFVDTPNALPSIWTYGHRSPQGLEFNPVTGQLWGTEMGPRGGDEVNLLEKGKNYGWPLYSKGLDYDGTPVEYGKELGIELNREEIEEPKVDLTPSPAVSSFIIYDGNSFPAWQQQLIVGSLKATELYRMVVEGDEIVHTELLLKDIARIRDIEAGPDGNIYLLLEHDEGGKIIRLVNEDRE